VTIQVAGIRHIERPVLRHRLLSPTLDVLAACHDKTAAPVKRCLQLAPRQRCYGADKLSDDAPMHQGLDHAMGSAHLDSRNVVLVSGSIASNDTRMQLWRSPAHVDRRMNLGAASGRWKSVN